jgi:hypothetical protein
VLILVASQKLSSSTSTSMSLRRSNIFSLPTAASHGDDLGCRMLLRRDHLGGQHLDKHHDSVLFHDQHASEPPREWIVSCAHFAAAVPAVPKKDALSG